MVVELDNTLRRGEPLLPARGMISRINSVHMVRHPQGSYIVSPLLSLEDVAVPKKQNTFVRSCRPMVSKNKRTACGSPPPK